jgi:hypothetical protein
MVIKGQDMVMEVERRRVGRETTELKTHTHTHT